MPKKYYFTQNPIYNSWAHIKQRCLNPKNKDYHNYGGRGIEICKEWLSFQNFEKDMKDSFLEGTTIDRIDNNGNYSKKNCRWATKKQQGRNTRVNTFFKGKTLSEWSEILNIKRSTLAQRYYVYHWSINKVLSV